MARRPAKSRVLTAFLFLGALVLPIVAYALGAYVVARGDTTGQVHPLFRSQTLLLFSALVVAGVGGFVIWSTARSLARSEEVEARLESLDGALADRLEESSPLMNSFTRMLATIEQQAEEIDQFAKRLDSSHRELESANARLHEVSFTDEVTRLDNRRSFSLRLEEEVGRYARFGHPFSLVLIDVDGFKGINDELGHLAGDETLRGVAELLLKSSRGIDVISRYGGDEFAVLLVETPRAGAGPYGERIRDVLSGYSFSHGRQVTASFGVASLPDNALTADDLIRAADDALYAAKRAGKNRVVMSTEPGAAGPAERETPGS